MTPTNKDIKVLGRVVSVAVDSIVVDASQVKDSTLNEFQDIINKRVRDKLDSFDHEIVIDGRSQGDETRINESGISTFSLSATSGEFDTLTVDDSISADNISIEGNGSIGGNFSVAGELTVYAGPESGERIKLSENGIVVDSVNSDAELRIEHTGITATNGDNETTVGYNGIVTNGAISCERLTVPASGSGHDIVLNDQSIVLGNTEIGVDFLRILNSELTSDDFTTDRIAALHYAPKEVDYNDVTTFLNSKKDVGRYYFEHTRSLNNDPCTYGIFIDVMVERDRDDNTILKVYQTLTMACRNNPDSDLASYIYRTYNAVTNQWTTVVEPGKNPFIDIL